jgi:hypothetical protein
MTTADKIKTLQEFADQQCEKHDILVALEFTDKKLHGMAYHSPFGRKIVFSITTIEQNSIGVLKDVYLHELAHSLNGGGFEGGHNKRFRKICKQIGCKGYNSVNYYRFFDRYDTCHPTNQQILEFYLSFSTKAN